MIQERAEKEKEINIKIDFRDKKPVTEQIEAGIRDIIEQGQLDPGEQLPTVRQLASQLRVNFNTVARAYRMLDQLGYITMRQGRGTFVTEGAIISQDEAAPSPTDTIRSSDTTTNTASFTIDKLEPGDGIFAQKQRKRNQKRLEQMVDQVLEKARRMHISIEEVIQILQARSEQQSRKSDRKKHLPGKRNQLKHSLRQRKQNTLAGNNKEK